MEHLRTSLPRIDWRPFLADSHSLLTPKEKRIIGFRHGLTDGKYHSLQELGNEFGVTRERIRQIEASAATKVLATL